MVFPSWLSPLSTLTAGILCLLLLISGCSGDQSLLEEIKERKELRVVTRNNPTTYYEGSFGPQGIEYELAHRFAARIGVKLKIIVEDNLEKMFQMVQNDEADLIAAGLTITKQRKSFLRFGPGYQKVTQQLVFRTRTDTARPRKIPDIIGGDIDVVASSSHVETLKELQKKYPNLSWNENAEMDSDELLQLVWSQFIDYTIADSTEIKLGQRFMPELAVAFDVSEPQEIGWAFKQGVDDSVVNAVIRFFNSIKTDGTLKQLINKYYGHVRKFNYVGTQTYMRDIAKVLPDYRGAFREAAEKYNLDWRLLAAIGYQESHWNPKAVSPTGVRGIMMLTQDTARFVKIKDRKDALQSIQGGAKYYRYILDKIPERIAEPDRSWLALAAYNVGYGHLEDARILTEKRGKDPDKWVDVRESLPLLSKRKWYKKTKHGYARGNEPVGYVANIRNYYELLVWRDESGGTTYTEQIPINTLSPAL